jgi:hypothetical protein
VRVHARGHVLGHEGVAAAAGGPALVVADDAPHGLGAVDGTRRALDLFAWKNAGTYQIILHFLTIINSDLLRAVFMIAYNAAEDCLAFVIPQYRNVSSPTIGACAR